ncbi:hypothetical protein UPYG_G00074430 [Umbra pygmaea]|uniref:Uncharacterized protein n=1 Tax=Umbra pygmaea TaxID=75934 RepID=A0ABD0XX37_UMBPY
MAASRETLLRPVVSGPLYEGRMASSTLGIGRGMARKSGAGFQPGMCWTPHSRTGAPHCCNCASGGGYCQHYGRSWSSPCWCEQDQAVRFSCLLTSPFFISHSASSSTCVLLCCLYADEGVVSDCSLVLCCHVATCYVDHYSV